MLGPDAAKELEAAEAEGAEKITHRIPDEFLGIGVRIEDDIAITEDNHENLTYMVPVEMDDIEALCAEPTWLTRQ
jgi:Xaa-Pro aminopeptidase